MVRKGKMPDGLNSGQQALVRTAVQGLTTARAQGKRGDVHDFYDRVRTNGAWDFKEERYDNAYPGVSQGAREIFGNWYFGASGAAWQHGRVGRLGALASEKTGIGDDILRRGAGAYQIKSDIADPKDPKKHLSAVGRLLSPLGYPSATASYGDNPGDGGHISQGYRDYNRMFVDIPGW
jgi:hypothetical protein